MVAAIALCLALLPPFKATLFALQWKHKAREATHERHRMIRFRPLPVMTLPRSRRWSR